VNENFSYKPALQTENFTTTTQNFYLIKNSCYENSNANFSNQQNKNNCNNNSSKLNFINKGNENLENIPPNNHSEFSHNSKINSLTTLEQKHQIKVQNKSNTISAMSHSAIKDPNLSSLSLEKEKQIPLDFIFEIWYELRDSPF